MTAFLALKRRHLPTLAALIGLILGLLAALTVGKTAFGVDLPITVLSQGEVFRTLIRSYGKEALPLAFSIFLSLTVKHPLPLLLEIGRRGFFLAFSAVYLAWQDSLPLIAIYLLLHLAALLTHIAAGIAALTYEQRTGLFPILYFLGLLFFLTIIRLLAFTLLL